jgi:hypothetical protein
VSAERPLITPATATAPDASMLLRLQGRRYKKAAGRDSELERERWSDSDSERERRGGGGGERHWRETLERETSRRERYSEKDRESKEARLGERERERDWLFAGSA